MTCRGEAIDRRGFLKAAGIAFTATLSPRALMALERADAPERTVGLQKPPQDPRLRFAPSTAFISAFCRELVR